MNYSRAFLRIVFLISLLFFASGCAVLEKQRQQAQVLLNGKTFTVQNKSEDEIYLSLLKASGENSVYERVRNLEFEGEKVLTINSYFFTQRGSFSLNSIRNSGRSVSRSSFIIYEVTFTVSGNQVTAVPNLRRYCRGRNNETDVIGSLSAFNCQKIDNSFNSLAFRILTFFNNFYDRVERIINRKDNEQ